MPSYMFLGQLRTLFGDIICEDLLLKLNAVFLTHGHQDHYHGIFTIVQCRKKLFMKRGELYVYILNFNFVFLILI